MNKWTEKKGLIGWCARWCAEHKTLAEIIRFVITGGIATVIDFVVTGIVLYLFNPSLYPNFFNVFYGGGSPSNVAAVISTGVGFCVSLIANYLLSVFFVFSDKGNSKSAKGVTLFVLLSVVGLLINMLGMYVGYDLLGINEWITKIIMTIVVLIYNYISRKLFIFKKKKEEVVSTNTMENNQ